MILETNNIQNFFKRYKINCSYKGNKIIYLKNDDILVSYALFYIENNVIHIFYIYTFEPYRNNYYSIKLLNKLFTKYENEITLDNNSNYANYMNGRLKNRKRLDCHIHLGYIPKSTSNVLSQSLYTSVEEVEQYILRSNLTDAVILYRDYKELERLNERVKNRCNIYGLKWVDVKEGKTKIEYLNELDINKPLFKGVKIHNIRHFDSSIPLQQYSYPLLKNLLDCLDKNMIVLPHIQQTTYSSPFSLLECIIKYPHIKFILGHCGAYGGPFLTKPHLDDSFLVDNSKRISYSHYMIGNRNVYEALELSRFNNVFLDSSIFYASLKAKIFKLTDHAMFGSDYPFGIMKNNKLSSQEDLYAKHIIVTLNEIHKNAIDFITKDIDAINLGNFII